MGAPDLQRRRFLRGMRTYAALGLRRGLSRCCCYRHAPNFEDRMTDTRILTLHPIPASAEAKEQRLREIRENTTVAERMAIWQSLWEMPQVPKRAA